MRKLVPLIYAALLFGLSAQAQVSYDFTATTGTYTPISKGTNPTLVTPYIFYGEADEGYANDIPLEFTFNYNGVSYEKVNINANGFLSLGAGFMDDPEETFFENNLTDGPSSQTSLRPIIAPLWDDHNLVDQENLIYSTTGEAPNRVFTVEWANASWSYEALSPVISFQVKMYETTNVIEFIYKWEPGEPFDASASIGISGVLNGPGNFLSLSNSSSAPVASSTVETNTISSRPATNQVYRFTPLACVAPSATQLTNTTATSVTFSWNAVPGVTSYEYANSTSETPPASGTATSSTTADITGLTPGVNNYLYVRSVCGPGNFSIWSRRATVICTTNILPVAGATTGKTTSISWAPVEGATSYVVMLGTNNANFNAVLSVPGTATFATLEELSYSTTYSFYIRPVIGSDTASTQCQSNATSFTVADPPVIPCSPITSPADGAKDINPLSAFLSWTEVPSATGYTIMLSSDEGNTYEDIGYTEFTFADLTGSGLFDYNSTYYFYVRPFIDADTASVACEVNAISFQTSAAPAPPVNDNCENAIELTRVAVDATTLGASESMEAEACNGFTGSANDDVWFKFTPDYAGSARISLTEPTPALDAVMIAYSGTCGSLTAIDCADDGFDAEDESLLLTNVVAGQTYYIRVFGFENAPDGGTFSIRVSGTALPITLVNFRGEKLASKNALTWTTANEQNSKGFELQRSADGNTFSSLGFINSKATNGTSSNNLHYTFNDVKPLAGNSYYRLKQIDRDGRFTYSPVVLIKGSKVVNLTLSSLYPNPTKSQLNLVITAPLNNKINVVVTDLAGKLVLQRSTQVVSGDNNIQLNVERLPAGSYMIKAICANGCETAVSKFVKQ